MLRTFEVDSSRNLRRPSSAREAGALSGWVVRAGRRFEHNDRITLLLPMTLKLSHWPGGGIALERGPVVYSLRIAEEWRPVADKRSSRDFPAWDIMPASDWNYALALDERNLADRVEVVNNANAGYPWDLLHPPVELRVPARKVRGWKAIHARRAMREAWWQDGDAWCYDTRPVRGEFLFTPPLPQRGSLPGLLGRRIETVTLVPYGCTHLRMTIFPRCV